MFAVLVIVSILVPAPLGTVVAFAETSGESVAVASESVSSDVSSEATVSTVSTDSVADTKTAEVSANQSAKSDSTAGNGGGYAAAGTSPSLCARVDMDGNGILNRDDFTAFENAYNNSDPRADFDQNGHFNANDFITYINAFAQCNGGSNPTGTAFCSRVDMDNNGVLNRNDFTAFELAYNIQDPRADFDQNGNFNANDFQAYINAFAQCYNGSGGPGTPFCTRVDMDGNGVLNGADFTAFETAYNNSDPRADFDLNGHMNANDFITFMNAYAQCNNNVPMSLCARIDMDNNGVLNANDFLAFEVAYNNAHPRADLDDSGAFTANDFMAFQNAYAQCTNGGTQPGGANILITPVSGNTTEAGGSFAFTISLNPASVAPTSPVTIALSSSDTTEGTISSTTVTLSSSNTSETVTVTGVDDATVDGNQSYSVVTDPSVSTDSNYSNINISDVSAVNADNDSASGGSGSTGGGGGGGTFSGGGGSGFVGGGLGEVLGVSTVNPMCNYLNNYLKRGNANDKVEVMKLQVFLKASEGASNLAINGIFDDATFDAVSNFQKKYSSDILTPWGYDNNESTGYVYILTKKKINEIFCKTQITLTPAQQEEIAIFRASMQSLAFEDTSKKKVSSALGEISATSTANNTVLANIENNREALRNLAAAVFTIPSDRSELLQSLYYLFIILFVIYVLTAIAVSSQKTNGLAKSKIRSRRAGYFVAGLVLAIVGVVFYRIFNLVMPLFVLLIAAATFAIWNRGKKAANASGPNFVMVPPEKK